MLVPAAEYVRARWANARLATRHSPGDSIFVPCHPSHCLVDVLHYLCRFFKEKAILIDIDTVHLTGFFK